MLQSPPEINKICKSWTWKQGMLMWIFLQGQLELLREMVQQIFYEESVKNVSNKKMEIMTTVSFPYSK